MSDFNRSASLEKQEVHQSSSRHFTRGDGGPLADLESRATVDEVALSGHAATDKYGHALVQIDHKAEAALR